MAHPRFGKGGLGAEPPAATDFYAFRKKNTHFSVVFLSKSGFNPPLLALLVNLRYSISIFVCRLVITENISGRGQLPLLSPLATPLYCALFDATITSYGIGGLEERSSLSKNKLTLVW